MYSMFLRVWTDGDSDSEGSVVQRKKIVDSEDDGLSDIEAGGNVEGKYSTQHSDIQSACH